jgi:hypothetical protein
MTTSVLRTTPKQTGPPGYSMNLRDRKDQDVLVLVCRRLGVIFIAESFYSPLIAAAAVAKLCRTVGMTV